jgi:Osmosensitive K+ channel histidine kinase
MNDRNDEHDIVQQVRERDKKRAEFFATVSHDLKTPLNGIIGFSSLLLQDTPGLDAECLRQLNLIYSSARALLERIDNLLDLYRLESGKIKANLDWYVVAELAQQAVAPFAQKAADQGVQLEMNLNSAPGRLRIDAQLLSRVLKQLLSNALKFTRQGSIRLSVESETLDGDRVRVRFAVADTGIGIRPEVIDRLSGSLAPMASPIDRSYQSLGLGLALAREAAQLMGGVLQVESQAQKGTTVTLVVECGSGDKRR